MKKQEINVPKSGSRRQKQMEDPANFRCTIRMNAVQHAQFLSLFEQSGMKNKSRFILARIFNESFKVIKVDKSALDYYTKLTTFYAQFRAIGVNYNQIVKALNANFSEKKALAFLYKLEKATLELVELNKQIIELSREFESNHLIEK
jgi:hypothetical protein